MSAKISALPAATDCGNADLLTSVQVGVNKSITRPVLLTAKTGEDLVLEGPVSNLLRVGAAGEVFVQIQTSQPFSVVDDFGNLMLQFHAGSTFLIDCHGSSLTMQNTAGATVELQAAGGLILSALAGGNPTIQYTAVNPAVWAIAPPTDLVNAVDRLAQVVSGLFGGPIP